METLWCCLWALHANMVLGMVIILLTSIAQAG